MYDDADNTQQALEGAQLEAVFCKVNKFAESRDVADSINEKKLVVVNLENAPQDIARRVVDFLSGVAYANSATLSKIATSTFVVTPYFVETLDEMRGSLGGASFDSISF